MKFLYLLSLLVLCEGSQLQEAPSNVKLTSFTKGKQSGFVVNWTGVENKDEDDPILGYKVFIWAEDVDVAFELKDDGTLERKNINTTIVFNKKINTLFELKPNGQFVKYGLRDTLIKLWDKKGKFVYKLNSDGQLVMIIAEDIPPLELLHDSKTKMTEIDVPANKTEAVFNGTKRSHIYEVAVQAYTSKSTGPLSKRAKIVTY